jgi:hypothetical protein
LIKRQIIAGANTLKYDAYMEHAGDRNEDAEQCSGKLILQEQHRHLPFLYYAPDPY